MADTTEATMTGDPSPSTAPPSKPKSKLPKIIGWTVGLIVGVIGLLLVIGMLLPSKMVVEVSAEMDASPADIHPHVSDLKQWPEWTAWSKKQDSSKFEDLEYVYEGAKSGKGAIQKWTDANNGNGELEITDSEPISGIEYEMRFEGFDMPMKGTIRYKPIHGEKTKVTWTARGNLGNNPINRWFGLLFKDSIATDFKIGLSGLQELAVADAKKRRKLAEENLASQPDSNPISGPPVGGRGARNKRPGGGRRRDPQAFIARMMENDKDKDGKISKDELPERARQFFDRMDTDKDGFVDSAELKATAERMAAGGGRPGGNRPGGGSGRKRPAMDDEDKTPPKKSEKTTTKTKTPAPEKKP